MASSRTNAEEMRRPIENTNLIFHFHTFLNFSFIQRCNVQPQNEHDQ